MRTNPCEKRNSQGSTSFKQVPFFYTGVLALLIAFGSYAFTTFISPTVSVAADKMNVLYLGVDNPLTIAMSEVGANDIQVACEALQLIDQGNGHFIARAKAEGMAIIRVSSPGKGIKEVPFRVKKIPDPTADLNGRTGGKINGAYFKENKGLSVRIDRFEFDVQCEITNFHLTRVGKKEDPVALVNTGGPFNVRSQTLIEMAKPGDIYYFDKVNCRCPGDEHERNLNSLVFKIQ
jgi:hypothetical protein